MPAFSIELSERWKRRFERVDNVVCVGILFAASMPAIVVMLLLALPLLPLFAWCLCVGASSPTRFEASFEGIEAERPDHGDSSDHARTPTPHFA